MLNFQHCHSLGHFSPNLKYPDEVIELSKYFYLYCCGVWRVIISDVSFVQLRNWSFQHLPHWLLLLIIITVQVFHAGGQTGIFDIYWYQSTHEIDIGMDYRQSNSCLTFHSHLVFGEQQSKKKNLLLHFLLKNGGQNWIIIKKKLISFGRFHWIEHGWPDFFCLDTKNTC